MPEQHLGWVPDPEGVERWGFLHYTVFHEALEVTRTLSSVWVQEGSSMVQFFRRSVGHWPGPPLSLHREPCAGPCTMTWVAETERLVVTHLESVS